MLTNTRIVPWPLQGPRIRNFWGHPCIQEENLSCKHKQNHWMPANNVLIIHPTVPTRNMQTTLNRFCLFSSLSEPPSHQRKTVAGRECTTASRHLTDSCFQLWFLCAPVILTFLPQHGQKTPARHTFHVPLEHL